MKQYVLDEITEIEKKREFLTSQISKGAYSAYGETLAIEVIKIFNEILDYLKADDPANNKVDEIITRMPLLYLQISKIN